MDDDKGLELSLGLACGGSSSASKDKSGNSADGKTDPDERTNKILNDFKNFLSARGPPSFPRTDAGKPEENFFSNLQHTDTDRISNSASDNPDVSDHNRKRKSTFDENNNPKKPEKTNSRDSDLQETKGKVSHISITTDEGSTADNEDVAESEPEGSTSRFGSSHHEDGSRTPCASASSSQTPKEIPYSISMKESPLVSTPSTSNYALSGIMQGISSSNGVHPRVHTSVPVSLPMSFGFSPVQLPVLDNKDSTWRMGDHSQSLPSSYAGRAISPSGLEVRRSEQSKGQTQLLPEEGSSSQGEEDAKGRGNNFPLEFPAIRPGIAGDVKFGGSGSFPNLPWVSTTSPGPNSRTISGVTYKYNATQIKIVCACHGIHMSPEEFIQHATNEEQSHVPTPTVSAIRSTTNPTTSAKT